MSCKNSERSGVSVGEILLTQYIQEGKMCAMNDNRGTKKIPYFFNFIANSTASFSLNKKYFFPTELGKLINEEKPILGIEIPGAGQLAKIPGEPAPTDNVISSVFGIITLCDDCNNILQQIPFSECLAMLPGSKYYFANTKANIKNSYFTITGGTATNNSNGLAFYFYF